MKMPNRILKESICGSESLDSLTPFAETVFYRLIVNCDDYGRMDARTHYLKNMLFRSREVKEKDVIAALNELINAGIIIAYEVDGKPYLQMVSWGKHQQIRSKKSKYPEAPDINCNHLLSDDINCNHLISIDNKCSRNPIQSNPIDIAPNEVKRDPDIKCDQMFETFWSEYPNKKEKKKAYERFKKINPDEETFTKMMEGLRRQKTSRQWQESDGRFIPYPTTWLNGERWNDEVVDDRNRDSELDELVKGYVYGRD
jgi:hypothetical protein